MEYIVIMQSYWMNESGSGISYDWDGDRFDTRDAAIAHGWGVRGSDDFNVGVVDGDRLVSFDWMDQPIGEDAVTMAEIARACDLEFAAAQEDGHA